MFQRDCCGIEPFISPSGRTYGDPSWRAWSRTEKLLVQNLPSALRCPPPIPPAPRAPSLSLCLQSNGSLAEWSRICLEGGVYSLGQEDRTPPISTPVPAIRPSVVGRPTPGPSQEADGAYFQVVMWAGSRTGEVEDVHHREQGGVQGVEHKMGLVPAAIFYLESRNAKLC